MPSAHINDYSNTDDSFDNLSTCDECFFCKSVLNGLNYIINPTLCLYCTNVKR